jgi:hypothetical protein
MYRGACLTVRGFEAISLLWVVTEFFVNGSQRRARKERIAYHINRAETLARWRANSSHQLSPKLSSEMNELSSWHSRRAREIAQSFRFDLAKERQIDVLHRNIESAVVSEVEDLTSQSY